MEVFFFFLLLVYFSADLSESNLCVKEVFFFHPEEKIQTEFCLHIYRTPKKNCSPGSLEYYLVFLGFCNQKLLWSPGHFVLMSGSVCDVFRLLVRLCRAFGLVASLAG